MPRRHDLTVDYTTQTRTIERLEALDVELPGELADAWRAARTLEDAHRAPVDDTTAAHNAAVAELVATARTGKSLDTGQAAKAVAAAIDARRTADARKAIVEDALGQAERDAITAYRRHLVDVIPALRPTFDRLTARLDHLAEQIPPGTDDATALHLPPETQAAYLEATQVIIPQLEQVLDARQALYNDIGRPRRSFFAIVRNMDQFDDTRLLHAMASAGGITTRLPDGAEWWLHLARSGADWWLPTPDEQDARADEYDAAARARLSGAQPSRTRQAELAVAAEQRRYFNDVGGDAA